MITTCGTSARLVGIAGSQDRGIAGSRDRGIAGSRDRRIAGSGSPTSIVVSERSLQLTQAYADLRPRHQMGWGKAGGAALAIASLGGGRRRGRDCRVDDAA